jgi:exonuclease III
LGDNEYVKKFKKFSKDNKFCFLHLNINSLRNKLHLLKLILNLRLFDIVFLNETRLDFYLHPLSVLKSPYYNTLRSDREEDSGGGILIFVRNEYVITKSIISSTIEAIFFQISIKKLKFNFVSCYNPPNKQKEEFITELEDFMFRFNLDEPLFLIGDFNIDLLTENHIFSSFLKNYDLKNFVEGPTRIFTKFYEKNNISKTSKTLIDLVLHNKNFIKSNTIIDCPFSDHCFILTSLDIKSTKPIPKYIASRNYSIENLFNIKNTVSNLNFQHLKELTEVNKKWLNFKDLIMIPINSFCPLKKLLCKPNHVSPWIDNELQSLTRNRDKTYYFYKKSASKQVYDNYCILNKDVNDLTNFKMIEFFKNKEMKDFKNSKKFFNFYKSSFKIKSDKSNCILPNFLTDGKNSASNPLDMSRLINKNFTNIKSVSDASNVECEKFISSTFDNIFKNKKLPQLSDSNFKFQLTTTTNVSKLILKLNSSNGPGISDIHVKIFKTCVNDFAPIITDIINECISSGSVPSEWKCAVVTALFKGKGPIEEINGYRGISVLAIITKIFEKIIATQILIYLKINKLLFSGQYGFRESHSCEAALHDILSQINIAKNKRLISLLLFIDFRKAFDLVDSSLLIFKLKKLGFGEEALKLMTSYFSDRSQCVKFDGIFSEFLQICLGVPQGSILGPLLFIIFINDLAFFLDWDSKMFADDTTLLNFNNNLETLLINFDTCLNKIKRWCNFNRLDINWSKTKVMFIHNKRNVNFPSTISFDDHEIEVVDEFKLLGVTIDNRMNFKGHVSIVRHAINKKLYSIKELFHLPKAVKVQFFKTFILPHFDYCLSLLIYFSKDAIQSLSNSYYLCLLKLFDFNMPVVYATDFNLINNELEKIRLNSFLHRFILKLFTFVHKIYNDIDSPLDLKNQFIINENIVTTNQFISKRNLRNRNHLYVPATNAFNNYGQQTFSYFFSKLINKFCINDLKIDFILFQQRIFNNINVIFIEFIKVFEKFDLNYPTTYFKYLKQLTFNSKSNVL